MTDYKLSTIKQIIAKYRELAHAHVFIFGSRATHTNQKYSDIDIGIESTRPIKSSTLFLYHYE